MRYIIFTALLVLSACTIEQQGDYRHVELAPIFGGQQWETTQDANRPACSVSAGEMNVTLSRQGMRVGTTASLSPGDSYKILAGDRNYETNNGIFRAADSQAIVRYLLSAKVVYTETVRRIVSGRGAEWKRWPNKIPMEGFAQQYHSCERFVR